MRGGTRRGPRGWRSDTEFALSVLSRNPGDNIEKRDGPCKKMVYRWNGLGVTEVQTSLESSGRDWCESDVNLEGWKT